ncbi:MAG TPA: DUF72 domain-containing protein [Kofleriaceae bacterium]|nr:DUF72 domain-containing protein [Kofleriaceae bacterium]
MPSNPTDPPTDTGETAPRRRIGCTEIPAGVLKRRYYESLDYLELGASFFQVPRPASMRKRVADAPAGFGFGMVASQVITHAPGPHGYSRRSTPLSPDELRAAGNFADTPVVRAALDRLVASALALQAEVVVFRSGPSFAPSAANRSALERFFAELATAERFGGATRVWEPQGLWTVRAASAFSEQLGVTLGCDPLAIDPTDDDPMLYADLPGGAAYFRISGFATGGVIPEHAHEDLAELALSYERCWVVFDDAAPFPDAMRFRRVVSR